MSRTLSSGTPKLLSGVIHLTHDRYPDALPLEIRDLAIAARPHRRIDPWVRSAGELDDTPRLKAFGGRNDYQAGARSTRAASSTPATVASP
jgi:hypothetical protein